MTARTSPPMASDPVDRVRTSHPKFRFNRIVTGDARRLLLKLPADSVDLSFWSPPYYVGKSYEQHLNFQEWQALVREVVQMLRRFQSLRLVGNYSQRHYRPR